MDTLVTYEQIATAGRLEVFRQTRKDRTGHQTSYEENKPKIQVKAGEQGISARCDKKSVLEKWGGHRGLQGLRAMPRLWSALRVP